MKVWKIGSDFGEQYGYNPIDLLAYLHRYHKRVFMVCKVIFCIPFYALGILGGVLVALRLLGLA